MKIAVCDDTALERKNIVCHIERYYHGRTFFIKIEEFTKKETLVAAVVTGGFDVVFVCFNGADGIETAKQVRALCKTCLLVIVSDTADYGIEAHCIWTIHYLFKPVCYKDIGIALTRCEKVMAANRKNF